MISTIPVTLHRGEAKLSTGELRLARWDRRERLWRAAKVLLLLWALAAVSVLIPVAHFLLVPAFLIAGPIAAWRRARQESGIVGGQGPCPDCGKPMTLEAGPEQFPRYDLCESCHASIRVERA